jgi:hypothetical protein
MCVYVCVMVVCVCVYVCVCEYVLVKIKKNVMLVGATGTEQHVTRILTHIKHIKHTHNTY